MSVKPRRTSRRSKPANTPTARRSIRSPVRADGRDNPQSQQAFTLPDDVVEEALRTGDQPGLLEDLFGPAGYVELRALARQACAPHCWRGSRVAAERTAEARKEADRLALGLLERWGWADEPLQHLEIPPRLRCADLMRCKDCSTGRGHPYKRSHLIALRPKKISASDPPSSWWPGERD